MAKQIDFSDEHQALVKDIRNRLLWLEDNWHEPIGNDKLVLPPVREMTEEEYSTLFNL